MEVNAVVPNIVLHFHGFRLSLLSNLSDALWHLAVDMLRKMMVASAACGACVLASQAVKMSVPMLADGLVSGLITFATFSSCTVLAQGPARLMMSQQQEKYQQCAYNYNSNCSDEDDVVAVTKAVAATAPTTLPLLSTKHLAPVVCMPGSPDKKLQQKRSSSSASTSPTSSVSKLPSIRRRVLSHLRQGPPIVNIVAGETRRRAQMPLRNAKIRVGKAHTQLLTGAKKPQDVYLVRVDCGSQGDSEKHMNPVIMWDITATFDEFKKLEHELKREVKTKSLDAKVPHLSSGAVLFVQPELTDHVLNARRSRLQAFVDAIRTSEVLAGTDSLRKFCQAY
ncbi:Phox homologous domain [Globisporangium polare]